jgi:filamentous hemagglutinin family protein
MRAGAFKQILLNSAALGAGLAAVFLAKPAFANPLGATVTSGSASIATPASGNTRIDQTSEGVVIDWSSFNIGAGQTTQFVQPNAQAIAVNRIGGNSASQILGTLDANGRVVLINGNGLIIGKGARINVGSLIATTTDGSDGDVLSSKFTNAGNQNAKIVNQGVINASASGFVALVAPSVTNAGIVNAKLGTVALGAANKFTVDFTGDGLVSFAAQGDVNAKASVANTGSLNGANVSLTAHAAEGVATGVVNVGGVISAQGVDATGGAITLDAGNGALVSTAYLDAGGKTGGGTIETSGEQVSISGHVTAGTGGNWKVDPYDLTVDTTAATTIDGSLNSGTNVSLQTTATGTGGPGNPNASGNGDIFIDSPISWGTTATLSLSAYRNIDFNASVTASGGGSVSLATGTGGSGDYSFGLGPNGFAGSLQFTGGSLSGSTLTINGAPYRLLYSISDVQNINNNLSGEYALATSIDAPSIANWVPLGTDGNGNAINFGDGFTGSFEGLGNIISQLTVTGGKFVGLFGYLKGAIRDVGVAGGSASGSYEVGDLVGWGYGTISDSYATGNVGGTADVGGLMGWCLCNITKSYATGSVQGNGYVGGLVGFNPGGNIASSYATGTVNASNNTAGGLIGYAYESSVSGSFATGGVSATGDVAGGLIGFVELATVSNSYSVGPVNGAANVGGLAGASFGSTIADSYSAGAVTGSSVVGGFIGLSTNETSVTKSYWDTQTSGQSVGFGSDDNNQSGNVTGLTTAQLSSAMPSGFDPSVWGNVNNQSTPYLLSNPGPVYIGSDGADLFTLVFTMAQL